MALLSDFGVNNTPLSLRVRIPAFYEAGSGYFPILSL